jgi:isopenicillin N synthase-like dioxygenase
MEITTIDISKIGLDVSNPSKEAFQKLAPLFRDSFSKIGFAYISNHGIDPRVIDQAFQASKSFFDLPQEVKEKSVKTTSAERGYVRPGQEIFDAKEDWTQVG